MNSIIQIHPTYKQANTSTAGISGPHIQLPLSTDNRWLGVSTFSGLASISTRAAQSALSGALKGKEWRGQKLIVREVDGQGGASGKNYEVLTSSLPAELREKLPTPQPQPMPEAPTACDVVIGSFEINPNEESRTRLGLWRYSIIEPILQTPERSKARIAAIDEVVRKEHVSLNGQKIHVSKGAIYNWLKSVKAGGIEALCSKLRNDRGRVRTLLTREWDKACPLSTESKVRIAETLIRYVRSLWKEGVSGWRQAQTLASSRLVELCREAGWDTDADALVTVCKLSRTFVEGERKYALVATHDKDAKQFFDKHLPRITRNRDGILPMDIIVADVHPIDIGFARTDGTIAYPRAIAWHDVATNRVRITLIQLEKGEGVRQEHVAQSFAAMCSQWGLPRMLYLDNGGEYNFTQMMVGFNELARLSQNKVAVHMLQEHDEVGQAVKKRRSAIIRSLPYNGPGKAVAEGTYGVLEGGVFAMVPGWVGGNRMRKKTHNVGKEPKPFPGTWEDFHSAIATAQGHYHNYPQHGGLNGKSPYQTYQEFIERGWGKTSVTETAMLLAFAEEKTPTADRGRVTVNGITYYHDKILPFTGKKLRVRVARFNPDFAFVLSEQGLICMATPEKTYGQLDRAGAKEKGRRTKVLKRHIGDMHQDCDRLDLVEEMQRHAKHQPAPPEAPASNHVALTPEVEQMVRAQQEHEDRASKLLEQDSTDQDPSRLSQWSSPDEPDPYLDAVNWD